MYGSRGQTGKRSKGDSGTEEGEIFKERPELHRGRVIQNKDKKYPWDLVTRGHQHLRKTRSSLRSEGTDNKETAKASHFLKNLGLKGMGEEPRKSPWTR